MKCHVCKPSTPSGWWVWGQVSFFPRACMKCLDLLWKSNVCHSHPMGSTSRNVLLQGIKWSIQISADFMFANPNSYGNGGLHRWPMMTHLCDAGHFICLLATKIFVKLTPTSTPWGRVQKDGFLWKYGHFMQFLAKNKQFLEIDPEPWDRCWQTCVFMGYSHVLCNV